jgi:cysteine desulfurase/selenocysteine lyase
MTPIVDIEKIRTDFPILSDQIFGKPLIYFDNAATTQKPRCVLDKMTELYTTQNANIHRGVHHEPIGNRRPRIGAPNRSRFYSC